MTWKPEDRLRQANVRGKRGKSRKNADVQYDAPQAMSNADAMPTLMAGTMGETMDDEANQLRLPMEQEQALASMGFVPDRQWNMIRQWMFRGTTAL